jgi:hypothetical protein
VGQVISLKATPVGQTSWECSKHAQFWREAFAARGCVFNGQERRIHRVLQDQLRALHAEEVTGLRAAVWCIGVIFDDHEALAGPMMRGFRKVGQEWVMGDDSRIRFLTDDSLA